MEYRIEQKRIKPIKEFLGEAKSHSEIKRLIAEDWVKAEYIGTGKKDHVIIIKFIHCF